MEFLFAVIIFAVIIFFIATQLNVLFSTSAGESGIDNLKAHGINVLNVLLEDKGNPENWELDPSRTIRVGLASDPYKLTMTKIIALSNNCDLLERFDLNGYSLEIFDENKNPLLFCGFRGVPPITVSISKSALIENELGEVRLVLW